jgi:uncharacterized protein involved in exopolysaccharide biosynthesis
MILTSNPQIAALHGQLNVIRTEYARVNERYKEKHPRIIELQSTIDEMEGRIRGEVLKAIGALRITYEMARSQEEALVKELDQVQWEVIRVDEERIHYLQLMNASKVNRMLFDTMLGRLEETRLVQSFENPIDSV